jgi:hypothetical protein
MGIMEHPLLLFGMIIYMLTAIGICILGAWPMLKEFGCCKKIRAQIIYIVK